MPWLMSRLTNRTMGASSSCASERFGERDLFRAALLFHGGGEVADLAVGAKVAVDGGAQVAAFGDDGAGLHAGCGANVVEGEHVARVDHGDHEVVAGDTDRKHLVPAAHGGGNERHGDAVDGVLEKFDVRKACLRGTG